jgi:hypothetical protein
MHMALYNLLFAYLFEFTKHVLHDSVEIIIRNQNWTIRNTKLSYTICIKFQEVYILMKEESILIN